MKPQLLSLRTRTQFFILLHPDLSAHPSSPCTLYLPRRLWFHHLVVFRSSSVPSCWAYRPLAAGAVRIHSRAAFPLCTCCFIGHTSTKHAVVMVHCFPHALPPQPFFSSRSRCSRVKWLYPQKWRRGGLKHLSASPTLYKCSQHLYHTCSLVTQEREQSP